jgi:hypothetical protein
MSQGGIRLLDLGDVAIAEIQKDRKYDRYEIQDADAPTQ